MQTISLLLISTFITAAAAPDDGPLSKVTAGLSEIAAELSPDAVVGQDNASITLAYKTRTFLVHAANRIGRYSENAHEETGPSYDGLLVRVSLQDGRYEGAAKIPQDLRRPYWTTFINAYPVAMGKQHLWVNISYGSRPDGKTIERIKKLLESLVDDDPDARSQ